MIKSSQSGYPLALVKFLAKNWGSYKGVSITSSEVYAPQSTWLAAWFDAAYDREVYLDKVHLSLDPDSCIGFIEGMDPIKLYDRPDDQSEMAWIQQGYIPVCNALIDSCRELWVYSEELKTLNEELIFNELKISFLSDARQNDILSNLYSIRLSYSELVGAIDDDQTTDSGSLLSWAEWKEPEDNTDLNSFLPF